MKTAVCLVIALSFCFPARAADTEMLSHIYQLVDEDYIEKTGLDRLAAPALKALHTLDPEIRVGDDAGHISIYKKGRLVKSLIKPEDTSDVKAWAEVTGKAIDTAAGVSPELELRDFEIIDTIMAEGISRFDVDSSYYPDLDLSTQKNENDKNRRLYYDRMIDEVLYVKMGAINQYSADNLQKSLAANPAAKALILDLRGNHGGMFSEAVKIAGMFLDGGIIASTQGRSKDSAAYYQAEDGDALNNKPMAVLIDAETASSGEVIAASLKEQGRAVVIGSRSYGKGTVQKLYTLPNNSKLALTNAYFYTPSGNKIDKIGVKPDICTAGELESKNPQRLIKAQELPLAECSREKRTDKQLDIDVAVTCLLEEN